MLFNSAHFLLFFPLTTLVYFILPSKVRWGWLLLSSYYFYMCWNIQYSVLIAISTLITYMSGLLIDACGRIENQKQLQIAKKICVALSFFFNLAILFFFKYFDFTVSNINRLLSVAGVDKFTPAFDVLLPVGISFYTFQALSYTMDVYRGDIPPEKNLGKYALFVSFFPQLVAGPIERSKNLLNQIHETHTFDFQQMCFGLQLMLWGFFQKVVIADRVAIVVNSVYNNYQNYFGFHLVVATVLFAIQIYCDFSGYSNIAIGAAQVMGFRLMDNFNRPYFATSVKDFWRRWHISLSSWFRDYLYIPLGGSRCSVFRRYCNLMVTFLASGLWHGASWNYIIWGGLHGVYQIGGDLLKPFREKPMTFLKVDRSTFSHKLFQMVFTFFLIDFAWIFFRAPGVSAAFSIITNIFASFNPWIFVDGSLYTLGLNQKEFYLMMISILILWLVEILKGQIKIREKLSAQNLWFRWCVYIAAIISVLIFGVYGAGYSASEFIYFAF